MNNKDYSNLYHKLYHVIITCYSLLRILCFPQAIFVSLILSNFRKDTFINSSSLICDFSSATICDFKLKISICWCHFINCLSVWRWSYNPIVYSNACFHQQYCSVIDFKAQMDSTLKWLIYISLAKES